jgi:hypothetical protein
MVMTEVEIAEDDFRPRSRAVWSSIFGMIAGTALAAVLLLQTTGTVSVFGFDAVKISSVSHEIGYAYQIALPRWSLQRLADQRSFITEDGTALGPGNSQHDTIRSIGRGAFSFWHGALYISTSDNSDPRTNGRTYEVHSPATPPLIFVLLAVSVITYFGWMTYRAIDRKRVVRAFVAAGFDRLFLSFCFFTAAMLLVRPWDGLLETTGGAGDWLRMIGAAGIGIAFASVRARDLTPSGRTMFRFLAALFGAVCALRWYPDLPQSGSWFDVWAIFGNRFVGLVAAILAWKRPSFLIFAICSSLWARRAHEGLTGFPQADVDETPVSDMAIFFTLWCCCAVIAYRVGRKPMPTRVTQLGLYAALGIHFANYFHSAVAKLSLDGAFAAWIFQNPTHALLATAKELGAAPLAAFPHLFDLVYQTMAGWIVEVNALTLISQAMALPAILFPAAAPSLLILYDLWHFSVFATTGIFFWKWMVVNAGFYTALRRSEAATIPAILASLVLCVCAPAAFHIFPAAWYDTFMLNRMKVTAVAEDGDIRVVPPAFFLHYTFAAASSTFWTPEVFQSLYPTASYGTTYSSVVMRQSRDCPEARGFAQQPHPFKTGVESMVRKLDAEAVRHADHEGRPSPWLYLSFPYHISTNPLQFREFWSLDLRRVKVYVLEIQAVCTARPTLNDPVKEGPKAALRINVSR